MPSLIRSLLSSLALATVVAPFLSAQEPPKTWVDKDTGHRVWRLSDEPNSGGFYFNINAYTPDHKSMIYTSPDGIHVLDMDTHKTRLLVPNPPAATAAESADPSAVRGTGASRNPHALVAGNKTNSVFYTQLDPATHAAAVYKADTNTGAIRKLTDLPPKISIVSVNADETLAAGTYIEGDATGKEYGSNAPAPPAADNRTASAAQGPHYQPENKGLMMERRLAARLPLVLFTIRLEPGPNGEKPGEMKTLLHSTDWVNHLLFSPTDPTLLMYCHEGPWQKVDRIWMIHTDGTHNTLIHKRTMAMEIAGHEFWDSTARPSGTTGSTPRAKTSSSPAITSKPASAQPSTCSATSGRFTSTSPKTSTSSPATAAIPARSQRHLTASGSNSSTPT